MASLVAATPADLKRLGQVIQEAGTWPLLRSATQRTRGGCVGVRVDGGIDLVCTVLVACPVARGGTSSGGSRCSMLHVPAQLWRGGCSGRVAPTDQQRGAAALKASVGAPGVAPGNRKGGGLTQLQFKGLLGGWLSQASAGWRVRSRATMAANQPKWYARKAARRRGALGLCRVRDASGGGRVHGSWPRICRHYLGTCPRNQSAATLTRPAT